MEDVMSGTYEEEYGCHVLRGAAGEILGFCSDEVLEGIRNHPEIKAAYDLWSGKTVMVGVGTIIQIDSTRDMRGRTYRTPWPHWQSLRGKRRGRRKP